MIDRKPQLVAPLTAAALIAQQVGANAIRDGLFLSLFAVQSLPYFIAAAAVLAIVAAQLSGRLLTRLGPARVVPALVAANAALFLVEWLLLGSQPRAAAVLLYLHSSVLGGIAISAFWSLLNERFDPHSAKPLMARVAGGGDLRRLRRRRERRACGRLAAGGRASSAARSRRRGLRRRRRGRRKRRARPPDVRRGHAGPRRSVGPASAAAAAAKSGPRHRARGDGRGARRLCSQGRGGRLFRPGPPAGAILRPVLLGHRSGGGADPGLARPFRARTSRSGRFGGEPPGRRGERPAFSASCCRLRGAAFSLAGCDVVVRNSTFRAGYELLYTPLAESAKRSVKSLIDVAVDCAGKGAGALLILLLVRSGAVTRVRAGESRRGRRSRRRVLRGAPTPRRIRQRPRRRPSTPGRGPGAGGGVLDGRLHRRREHDGSRSGSGSAGTRIAGTDRPTGGLAHRSGCRCPRRVPFGRSPADSRGPAQPASRSAHHRCPRAAPREGRPGAR